MPEKISFNTIKKPDDAPADPYQLFAQWYDEACQNEPNDPNAMCLSTITADKTPDSRIVLMKDLNKNGIVFYTNIESRKGRQLNNNPVAALNFYWKSLRRQVRISGTVEPVADDIADAYFQTRPKGSRIGAWASKQSRPLPDRKSLADRIDDYAQLYGADDYVPRPPHWSGFLVKPDRFEFWKNEEHRLHYRIEYEKDKDNWTRRMLYP